MLRVGRRITSTTKSKEVLSLITKGAPELGIGKRDLPARVAGIPVALQEPFTLVGGPSQVMITGGRGQLSAWSHSQIMVKPPHKLYLYSSFN